MRVPTRRGTGGPKDWVSARARSRASSYGRDGRHDDGDTGARQPRRHPPDPLDVRVAVFFGEAESSRKVRAYDVAV